MYSHFAKKFIPDEDLIDAFLVVIEQTGCYQTGYDKWELLPENRRQVWEEGVPPSEAYDVRTPARASHEGDGGTAGNRQRTRQPIGCIVCIGPHSITDKHRELHRNQRCSIATHCHATTVIGKHRSTSNVCAPRSTTHDANNATARTATAETRTRRT